MSRYDKPSHRVFMVFFFRGGWQVQFLESDAKTPLSRKFTFKDEEKIRELARRGQAWGTSENRQMLEYALTVGRGTISLHLTPGQYRALRNGLSRETPSIFRQVDVSGTFSWMENWKKILLKVCRVRWRLCRLLRQMQKERDHAFYCQCA